MYARSVEMAESECSGTTDESENEESSGASSVLSLHYSSSPFESRNSSSSSEDSQGRVEPYLYEPKGSGSEETGESSDDDTRRERLSNTEW